MPNQVRLAGADRARLQPKLQMIANGSSTVNTVRAEQASALAVTSRRLLDQVPARRTECDAPVTARQAKRVPAKKPQREIPSGVEANVFVQLVNSRMAGGALPGEISRKGRIVRARVALKDLPKLARDPRVAFVEIGESLKPPRPTLSDRNPAAPSLTERRFGTTMLHRKAEKAVLIGIIDVGGFDFSHPDFLDNKGRTRFLAIWDQGGDARPHPAPRSPGDKQFAYGAEFRQEHLNAAIQAAPALGVPAWEIERQSQISEGSHATHVASIAAGNRGVCRRAAIAGVLVSLPAGDEDRRKAFYDSTRLADAVDYLVRLAEETDRRLSINISLGTNGHAHDGSGAIGRYLDSVFSAPGRALTVAAGNAGQEKAEGPDDLGWMMGRIHTSGRVAASGLALDLDWVVVGNGNLDLSENELELWFAPQDRLSVQVRGPNGVWTEEIRPLEFIENRRLPDGSFLSLYNEIHHPSNGANCISVYLSPNLEANPVIGIPAGTWTIRLKGLDIRDGRFDGWIERDDPRPLGRVGSRQFWALPSFFSERSLVDNSTVSSLGCGNRVLTVANLDAVRNRINPSSSQGPSRDGRTKPDIAAPGTDIVAAKGFSTDEELWIGMTGTSMASPFIAGLAGLMLAAEPGLTAAQIEAILRSTATPLPGANYAWANDSGFGAVEPAKCLEQAARINHRVDRTEGGSR